MQIGNINIIAKNPFKKQIHAGLHKFGRVCLLLYGTATTYTSLYFPNQMKYVAIIGFIGAFAPDCFDILTEPLDSQAEQNNTTN